MAGYLSDELFHFVGHSHPDDHEANYARLLTILDDGCVSHAPHNRNWGAVSYTLDPSCDLSTESLLVPTVTCYCDIPFSCLGVHLAKYGQFGIGLTRHHLIRYGARPVIYIPVRQDDWSNSRGGGSAVLSALEATFRGLHSQLGPLHTAAMDRSLVPAQVPRSPADAVAHLDRTLTLEVLAFVKPYNAMLQDGDQDYFYSEREWRKFGNMKFEPQDLTRVVVHPEYYERAKRDRPHHAARVVPAPTGHPQGAESSPRHHGHVSEREAKG